MYDIQNGIQKKVSWLIRVCIPFCNSKIVQTTRDLKNVVLIQKAHSAKAELTQRWSNNVTLGQRLSTPLRRPVCPELYVYFSFYVKY